METPVLHKKSVLTLQLHRKKQKTSFGSHYLTTAAVPTTRPLLQYSNNIDYFDNETQYPQATIITHSLRAHSTELAIHAYTYQQTCTRAHTRTT